MDSTGNKIRWIRKSYSLTQEEFSKMIGISRPFLSCIENGKSKPSIPVLLTVSLMFGIEIEWLKSGDNYEN